MEALFLKLVNMSITASWLVLTIIAVRLVFRKTPKWILCLLWGLVAVRLIFPFSIESALSLIPNPEPLPQDIIYTAHPQLQSGIIIVDNTINPMLESSMTPIEPASANPTQIWSFILSQVWILGMVLMLLYTIISYLLLKRKVATAIPLGKGIKQSEFIDSPFVLGLIRPMVYLPFGMEEADMAYVIAHEKAHIRRRDHWWKPLGFLLLSIYWFNPVLWVAYILLCRDIEAACDEKVIKDMGKEARRAYSTALLNCSIHRRRIAACPLAFGETGVKTRVKSVMNYKKPAFWVILIALVICIIISICFLTDPSGMHLYEIDDSRNYSDLFTNTDKITLIREGEEYPAYDADELLKQLDEVKVRKLTLDRSRSEDRDKTNRIQLREKLYLNFSWDYSHVWIDNLVKPTYTYRVINPDLVRTIFETLTGVNRKLVAQDVTPTSATVICFPEDTYSEVDTIWDSRYWLEHWDGNAWNEVKATGEKGLSEIDVNRILDEGEENKHYVDWATSHGVLSGGKYRLGTKFYFLEADDLRTFYAEFSIPNNVYTWFDKYSENASERYPKEDIVKLIGIEGKASYDSSKEQISLITAEGTIPVISSNIIIRSAFITDLTEDGISEICATVQTEAGMVVQVYNPSEKQLYQYPAEESGLYFLSNKADRLCILSRDDNWNLDEYGLLAVVKNPSTGEANLEICKLDITLESLTRTVSCIDINNRKYVCITNPQEIERIMQLLQDMKQQVTPASEAALKEAQEDSFNSIAITINYQLGEKVIYFSKDYRLVWEHGSEMGYVLTNPEPIRAYAESITDGVRREVTSGKPFASVKDPWDWCKNVNLDALESAQANICLAAYNDGNSSRSSSTMGAISHNTLQELLSILNQIPKDSFTPGRTISRENYGMLTSVMGAGTCKIAIIDGVNNLAVVFIYKDSRAEIVMTDEMEKVRNDSSTYLQSMQTWQIQDQTLNEFMELFIEHTPLITYFVGGEYDWQDTIPVISENFELDLRLPEGWIYETVTESDNSGIRCRPETENSGWIYFSFWPDGYEPEETDRFINEGMHHGGPWYISYPAEVSQSGSFDVTGAIWSYQRICTSAGDYAIINEGAGSWFLEYQDQIEDAITISEYTVE